MEAQLRDRGVTNALSPEFIGQWIESPGTRTLGFGSDFDGVKTEDGGRIDDASIARSHQLVDSVERGRLGGYAIVTGRELRQLPQSLLGHADIYGVSGHVRLLAGEQAPVISDVYREVRQAYGAFQRDLLGNPEVRRLLESARPDLADSRPPPEVVSSLTPEQLDLHFWDLVRHSGIDVGTRLTYARPEDHGVITEHVAEAASRHGLSGPSNHGELVRIVSDPRLKPNKAEALEHWAEARALPRVVMLDDADRGLGAADVSSFLAGQGELGRVAVLGATVLDRPYMVEADPLAGYLWLEEVPQFEATVAALAEGRAGRRGRA